MLKEFQDPSFYMQIATTPIVFLRKTMLTLESQNANDDRTIGALILYSGRDYPCIIYFPTSLSMI